MNRKLDNWKAIKATQPWKTFNRHKYTHFFLCFCFIGWHERVSIYKCICLLTHFGFVYMVLDGLIKLRNVCWENTKEEEEGKISFKRRTERSSVARDERAKKMNGKIIGLSGSLFEKRKMKCIYMWNAHG